MPRYINAYEIITSAFDKLNITLKEELVLFLASFHTLTTYDLINKYTDDPEEAVVKTKPSGGVIATLPLMILLERETRPDRVMVIQELVAAAQALVEIAEEDTTIERHLALQLLELARNI